MDEPPVPHSQELLLAHIEANPGIHKSALRRAARLSWGTVHHHLGTLSRQGRIRIVPTGYFTRLFPAAHVREDRTLRWLAALRNPTGETIARGLETGPGTVGGLAERLDIPAHTVRRHLRHLMEEGIVEREAGGRAVRYRLSDPLP